MHTSIVLAFDSCKMSFVPSLESNLLVALGYYHIVRRMLVSILSWMK